MIYFDNAATTMPYEEAIDSFVEVSSNNFGNPISNHACGRKADKILEKSRANILKNLGLSDGYSLIFTSGATESNNLALKGIALKYKNRGNKIITSNVEHSSIMNALESLKKFGFEIIKLPINQYGYVPPELLANSIDDKTILVSIMSSNNEIGSIFPIEEYRKIISKNPKCFFHCDATQSVGKINLDYSNCDLISFSSHKFGGLKGTGALIYKKKISFEPIENGGDQEYGFRGGTVNVAGIKAMDVALEKTIKGQKANFSHVSQLNAFLRGYLIGNDQYVINSPINGNPYVLSFSLKKKKASVVVEALSNKDIYVSSVSACNSKKEPFSYVIYALTGDKEMAANAIRVSFSPNNTIGQIEEFIDNLNSIMMEVFDR